MVVIGGVGIEGSVCVSLCLIICVTSNRRDPQRSRGNMPPNTDQLSLSLSHSLSHLFCILLSALCSHW